MNRRLFCFIAVSALLMASIAVAGFAQGVVNGIDGDREIEAQLTRHLINSGVRVDDEASLIQALKNKDVEIAFWAAELLSRRSKTRQIVTALSAASTDERDVVALSAVRSLQKFHEKGWEASIIKRLPTMRPLQLQVQFAGQLARSGHAEGWSFIRSAILSEKEGMVALALLDVPYFDGLKDPSGKTINIASELNLLFSEAVPHNRGKIQAKLDELAKRR